MELKQTIQKILVWAATGIEILLIVQTFAFARMGKTIAMLITSSLAALPIIGIIIHSAIEKKRRKDAVARRETFLRSKGVALEVALPECKINENKRTVYYNRQDIPIYSTQNHLHAPHSLAEPDLPAQSLRSQEANAIDAWMNPEQVHEYSSYDRCVCFVETTLTYKGREMTFISEPIFMDKISLGMYLSLYDKGFIYVNPKDDTDYFFDLDFLKQEG